MYTIILLLGILQHFLLRPQLVVELILTLCVLLIQCWEVRSQRHSGEQERLVHWQFASLSCCRELSYKSPLPLSWSPFLALKSHSGESRDEATLCSNFCTLCAVCLWPGRLLSLWQDSCPQSYSSKERRVRDIIHLIY